MVPSAAHIVQYHQAFQLTKRVGEGTSVLGNYHPATVPTYLEMPDSIVLHRVSAETRDYPVRAQTTFVSYEANVVKRHYFHQLIYAAKLLCAAIQPVVFAAQCIRY